MATSEQLAQMIQAIQANSDVAAKAAAIASLKTALQNDRLTALRDADAALNESQKAQLEFLRAYKRGNDLYAAQTELLSAQIPRRVQSDVDTTRRQYEINEYYYNQKMNILYALQVTYVALLLCVLPAVAVGMGLLPPGFGMIIGGVIAVIAACLIGWQIYYNRKLRDRAYWNRRYFTLKPAETTPA